MTIPGMPPMTGGGGSFGGVNFGDLLKEAGGTFQPLPKGPYDVIVSTCEAAQSSTGKLMYKITYKVIGGPYNGRTVYNNITLTTDNPNALKMFFMNMKAMGLDEAYFAQSPAPDAVAQALLDKTCVVVIDHRMYQGELREAVSKVKPAAGGVGGVPVPGAMNVGPGPIVPPQPAVVPASQPAPAPTPAPVAIPQPVNPAPAEPVSAAPVPVPGAVPTPAEASVTPAAPAAPAEAIPPGYEAIWATMPQAAKDAILASLQPAAAAPAQAAQSTASMTPPPPVVF